MKFLRNKHFKSKVSWGNSRGLCENANVVRVNGKFLGGMQKFYVGALKFCERMQTFLGEHKHFARECKSFKSEQKVYLGNAQLLKVPYCTPFWSFILDFDVLKNINLRYKYQKPSLYIFTALHSGALVKTGRFVLST